MTKATHTLSGRRLTAADYLEDLTADIRKARELIDRAAERCGTVTESYHREIGEAGDAAGEAEQWEHRCTKAEADRDFYKAEAEAAGAALGEIVAALGKATGYPDKSADVPFYTAVGIKGIAADALNDSRRRHHEAGRLKA